MAVYTHHNNEDNDDYIGSLQPLTCIESLLCVKHYAKSSM